MAKTTLSTIKNWFRTGLKPTQIQFWEVFDSFYHKDEKIQVSSVDQLSTYLDNKAEKLSFELHLADDQAHVDLFNLKVDKSDFAADHYGSPVANLAALAFLTQAKISTKQRRYVHSEGVDFFYDAALATGDVAPADQVGGLGFWMRGAALAEIIDNLTSVETGIAGSANQLRVLKGLIDQLNALVFSDDATLDEIQEIVNYIKQNKTDLQNLSIPNIAGLVAALDGKVSLTANETIGGQKRFSDHIRNDKNLMLKYGTIMNSVGHMSIGSTDDKTVVLSNGIEGLYLKFTALTQARLFEFPNASGTVALTSDLTSYAKVSRVSKTVSNTTQYTLILEDKEKHLYISNAIEVIFPIGVFAADDEIVMTNRSAGDVNLSESGGATLEVVSSQSSILPPKAFGGGKYYSGSVAGIYGQLKPI